MNFDQAITFLNETANYFSKRDTKGEDSAYWSNVSNADNVRKIASLISDLQEHVELIERQKRLAKLWLDVCEEQENNGYDWEATKKKILHDWNNETMSVDYWIAYMEASFVQNAIEHYVIDKHKIKAR